MPVRKRLTVGLVCGGRSGEHEVSLVSAASVYRALDPHSYRVIPIAISQDGSWRLAQPPAAQGPILLRGSDPRLILSPGPKPRLCIHKGGKDTMIGIDVFFPVLHGPYGEDGTIQGLFEMCGASYVGAGVLASAIGMDKIAMKAVFETAGLNVAPYVGFTITEWKKNRIPIEERIIGELDLPCFIKPGNSGSSVGISKVKTVEELGEAVTEAFRFDRKVIAERTIVGQEIECSVLGNDEPIASLPGEVIPCHEFYDYWDKYIGGRTQLIIPADLPKETITVVREAAIRAYRALDCAGMARVDFFLAHGDASPSKRLYINEINTIPGFTDISMYPKLWAATGIPYPRLLDRLIDLACKRNREKLRLKTTWKQGTILAGMARKKRG